MFNEKRAVSPVIATVLMILITMIGMTILFAFVTTYSDTYKAGVGSSVLESLTIEDIWLSPSPHVLGQYDNTAQISVYNTGSVDSVINSIYVDGSALTSTTSISNLNLNIKVPVGGHVQIMAQWSQPWAPYATYTFKIETQRGSNFETKYEAP